MLKLIALNGELQGLEFDLLEGLTIGPNENCDVHLKDLENLKDEFQVNCDSSGSFFLISKSKKKLIDLGGEQLSKLKILPGLIFSIGEAGFSIQEGEADKAPSKAKSFLPLKVFTKNSDSPIKFYPLEKPIIFDFVRGALLNTSMKVHWHPYSIGAKSVLHHFIDEHINLDDDILAIERSTEKDNYQTLLRPFISNFISINSQLISKPTIVKHGDLVEFSETAFYIRIK